MFFISKQKAFIKSGVRFVFLALCGKLPRVKVLHSTDHS